MGDSRNNSNYLGKTVIAGGFGGACLVLTGHPLDTIKVSLQTMSKVGNEMPYRGTIDCGKKLIAKEGLYGLYKGMGSPIVGITPIFAVRFFGFNLGKSLQQKNKENLKLSQLFYAGILSGCASSLITAPIERVKCLLQVQSKNLPSSNKLYKGPVDCAIKIYKQCGLKSVFKGLSVTVSRDAPNLAFYYVTYELLTRNFAKFKAKKSSNEKNALLTLFAGGISGMIYWVGALPFDVIKSRLQSQNERNNQSQTARQVFLKLINSEGIMALYRGAGPVFLRAFPANAACFFGFESALSFLNWIS